MLTGSPQRENAIEPRGEKRPVCSRSVRRRGVTLVELMISMLILTIVCLAWLEIIGIQSARKEARRREAVERLAGMMDAFMYTMGSSVSTGGYQQNLQGTSLTFLPTAGTNTAYSVFGDEVSPIGYQLSVVRATDIPNRQAFGSAWGTKKWLIGRLYNRSGSLSEAGKPFLTLPVCLGL